MLRARERPGSNAEAWQGVGGLGIMKQCGSLPGSATRPQEAGLVSLFPLLDNVLAGQAGLDKHLMYML
jgi:hypothetical protein